MSSTLDHPILEIRRSFDATPERVFDAWLTREQWQAWIGAEGMSCEVPEMEARVGGRYRILMHLSDGKIIPVAGEFKLIERPGKFAFTWGWDGDPARTSLVTVILKAVGGKTELTLRQEGLPTQKDCDDNNRGWNSTLNKLAIHLQRGTP